MRYGLLVRRSGAAAKRSRRFFNAPESVGRRVIGLEAPTPGPDCSPLFTLSIYIYIRGVTPILVPQKKAVRSVLRVPSRCCQRNPALSRRDLTPFDTFERVIPTICAGSARFLGSLFSDFADFAHFFARITCPIRFPRGVASATQHYLDEI
jgi:hypothetical protein